MPATFSARAQDGPLLSLVGPTPAFFLDTDGDEDDIDHILSRRHLVHFQSRVREAWEEQGVSLNLEYVSTVLINTGGGLNTNRAIEHTGNTHLTLSLDTEKLGWFRGGERAEACSSVRANGRAS